MGDSANCAISVVNQNSRISNLSLRLYHSLSNLKPGHLSKTERYDISNMLHWGQQWNWSMCGHSIVTFHETMTVWETACRCLTVSSNFATEDSSDIGLYMSIFFTISVGFWAFAVWTFYTYVFVCMSYYPVKVFPVTGKYR